MAQASKSELIFGSLFSLSSKQKLFIWDAVVVAFYFAVVVSAVV